MNTTKKLTTLLLAMITASMAFAYDFEVDGICYLINGSEVTVTSRTSSHAFSNDYTGNVFIPETVRYKGAKYTVTAIGAGAFYWCSELTSIYIPKSIKRIEGQYVFYACENLSVVEIESLESWCNIDFMVTNGYSISYSNPLSYAHHLYVDGEELTELVIPSGVTRIGTSAFCNLSYLSRLEIPISVTSIGNAAFYGCAGFDRLDIPDMESWMRIDIQGGESNPMGYARKVYLDGIEMSPELVIPETTTKISSNAFNGCKIITSVSIPSSVEKIGADAFLNCKSLKRVEIQDIAAWCNIVFETMHSNPISNTIAAAWWDEQDVAIYVNGSLVTQLDIPEGVTSIGDYAFAGAQFDHVTFPNTLVSIGNDAFRQSMLEGVILPESLQSLGTCAFYLCPNLQKVQINGGLEVIPESAFAYCSFLSEISLPSTVKEIKQSAFRNCRALTTMPMTDSLQIIEDYAFDSSGIKQLKTGKSLTSIGGFAFANCNNLISVEIGDQVTTLGDEVFYGSYSLQRVIVGNGVHKIPSGFCADCEHLLSVVLGNDVDTLEDYCFYYCVRLNTIICKAEVPPVMNGAEGSFFPSAVFQNATLYVPSGSIEAYRAAYVWEKFQNIVTPGDVNGDGEVNVGDLNSVIDVVIMGGNASHPRIVDADVNQDGEVNIGDVNAIIGIILEND